jgi:hypothetical protein
VTYAFACPVRFALRTVLEGVVSIANFPEEVDLILASKEGSSNTMDRCIAPSLSETGERACNFEQCSPTNLVVEATSFVEELEVYGYCIGIY